MTKTILSLFDYTGNFSKPYRDAGYNVIQVDLRHGQDIMDFDYKNIGEVYGIIAQPPCTDYAISGARWFKAKDKDGRTAKSQILVKRLHEIIEYHKPTLKFWVVENPMTRIHKLNTWLGKVKLRFQPYDYAGYSDHNDCYSKQTWLFGEFNIPKKKRHCNIVDTKKIHHASSKVRKFIATFSRGFGIAFFKANP